MSDAEKALLSPAMQEAVTFVELWQLSGSIIEFLRAIGWAEDAKGKQQASNRATYFRKKGVLLKHLDKQYEDLDWTYLNLRATAALATLAGRKEEAQILVNEVTALRAEAREIVEEIRCCKNNQVGV